MTFSQSNGVSTTSQTVTTGAPPAVLGSDVALVGSVGGSPEPSPPAWPAGSVGICQTFSLPSTTPYLSFYVLEGGTEYTFKEADQEAAIFSGSLSSNEISGTPTYLFAEQNCYIDPNNGLSPPWAASITSSGSAGCWPASYGGDWDGYENWLQGGFWKQMGPYDLTASPFSLTAGTYTLFVGNWYYESYGGKEYEAQFLYLGDVQLGASSTFPTVAPMGRGGKTKSITVKLSKRGANTAGTPAKR